MCVGVAAVTCVRSAVPVVDIKEVRSVVCMAEGAVVFPTFCEFAAMTEFVAGAMPVVVVDMEAMLSVQCKASGGR
jgi:hypothetical protein